jgi:hypothetical protein
MLIESSKLAALESAKPDALPVAMDVDDRKPAAKTATKVSNPPVKRKRNVFAQMSMNSFLKKK